MLNNPPGTDWIDNPQDEQFDVDASIDRVLDPPPLPKDEVIEAVWLKAEQTLVDLLPNRAEPIAKGGIHDVQFTEPDAVVAAVGLAIGPINRDNTATDE